MSVCPLSKDHLDPDERTWWVCDEHGAFTGLTAPECPVCTGLLTLSRMKAVLAADIRRVS